MDRESGTAGSSKGMVWTGRVVSALVALMLAFDGVAHVMKPPPVVEAFARLGYPLSASVGLGECC